jgi:hypothetical protein
MSAKTWIPARLDVNSNRIRHTNRVHQFNPDRDDTESTAIGQRRVLEHGCKQT